MQLLAIGDLHLGRQPTRLPRDLREEHDPRALGPAAAWQRAVDAAIEHRVAAVLLAGDVVEDTEDFYEAYADLRAGVERLTQHAIAVIAVVGNHDVHVLPQLADSLAGEGFQLLGRGGEWETRTIVDDNGASVAIAGWSFASDEVRTSPLERGVPAVPGIPTIGLLHCDRDNRASPHAPVLTSELNNAPVDAWLLGHIHKPDALGDMAPPMGYLGSLTGLDPGEPGAHGPWLIHIDRAEIRARQLPLAPLRWEGVDVALDGLESPEAVHPAVTQALQACHERVSAASHRPRAVGCRLRLTGRSPYRRDIEQLLRADDPRQLVQERDGIVYFIEAWRMEALPGVELETLARGSDPAGLLARKLLVLRGPATDERQALIDGARQRLERRVRERPFDKLDADAPDDAAIRDLLERAALEGLDALLVQREDSD